LVMHLDVLPDGGGGGSGGLIVAVFLLAVK
jgi:hypothetical protein